MTSVDNEYHDGDNDDDDTDADDAAYQDAFDDHGEQNDNYSVTTAAFPWIQGDVNESLYSQPSLVLRYNERYSLSHQS